MGQQQILLIVLATIVVSLAVAIGINLFISSSVETNRDQVVSDLVHLSSDAQAYFRKQEQYGGGAGSFEGWDIPDFYKKYEGGKIRVNVKANKNKVIIRGTGTEIGRNGKTKIKVKATVTPTGTTIAVMN